MSMDCDFNAPRDVTWPRGLVERMILSPVAHKLDIDAIDANATLPLAHASRTFRVPKLAERATPSTDIRPAKTLRNRKQTRKPYQLHCSPAQVS
jgi:hypothetical protein